MKRETIANDFNQAQAFIADVNVWPCKITISDDTKKRSLPASAQYYVWLPQIAKKHGENTEYIRKWMKKDIALPILMRGGCDYSIKMLWTMNRINYDYLDEKQKRNFVDMFKVTSVMNSKQHAELRDELQIFWAKNNLQLRYLNE